MTGDDGEDSALARLLARGLTYSEAGARLGMSESTVLRRMRSPKLRREVDAERGVLVDQTVAAISEGASDAVAVLRSVCTDTDAPIGLRIRAASELLTQLARWRGYEQTRQSHPRTAAESTSDLLDLIG